MSELTAEAEALVKEWDRSRAESGVWDDSLLPGGWVCGIDGCLAPIESEPCDEHGSDPWTTDELRDSLAAIEAAAVARHVRETGCDNGFTDDHEVCDRQAKRYRDALTIIAEAPERSDAPITVKARNIARAALLAARGPRA